MIQLSALDIFEELRFVWELLLAEILFAACFTRRRQENKWLFPVGMIVFSLLAQIYVLYVLELTKRVSGVWIGVINIAWYVLLSAMTVFWMYRCFEMTKADAIFLGAGAYSLQHMEYVVVNEVVARGLCNQLRSQLVLYGMLCAFTTLFFYSIFYRIFRVKLKESGGRIFEDTSNNIAFCGMLFVLVYLATFMCQTIFVGDSYTYEHVNYIGATVDFLICILLLWVQHGILQIRNINQEKEIVEHLLYERKRQYELSRENIETINHKCHDLKHQIRALEHVSEGERSNYIRELEDAIGIYDAVVETGNEVVNTIISEKALICGRRDIRLSCMVDASHLDFMSTLDIYALLGNALDNAIESVSRYADKDKRIISLTICAVGDFLSIQINNYCEDNVVFTDGLPMTTKRNKDYHGFGMKSMRHLAKKYGGSMATSIADNMFTLQILLPMPREFLRLYKEAKQ